MYSGKVPHLYRSNGYEMSFYNNKIASEGLEINGKKNGIWISYYPDGKVESITGYWNGMPEGVWKRYYTNGQLKEEGYHFRIEKPQYVTEAKFDSISQDSFWITSITNDKILKHGTWNKFDSAGVLLESVTYRKGKIKVPSNETVFKIDMPYWQGCEENYEEERCQPLRFERKNLTDPIALITPCCGDFTEVVLFKENTNIQLKRINVPLSQCPPKLDLTGLPDGNYSIQIAGCPIYKRAKFSILSKDSK
jgi:hypothetical protein